MKAGTTEQEKLMRRKSISRVLLAGVMLAAFGSGCVSVDFSGSSRVRKYRRKNIAVVNTAPRAKPVEFDGLSVTWDTTRGEEMTEAVERTLIRLGTYNVKDRSQLEKVLNELDLQRTDLVDPDTAVKAGKMAGLDGIVIVSTRDCYFKLIALLFMYTEKQATFRLIDVQTTDVIWAARASMADGSLLLPPATTLFTSGETKIARRLGEELRLHVGF